ncbi:MFS transporter [Gordonia polyisoprenivorans]|uniref:MFS transporter n=1 Tax=Gordonia polyisoprenivorans TaxID=84595 RepID=UPI00351BD12F
MSIEDTAVESTPPGSRRPAGSSWQRMRIWATAHAVDDFYQGLVPAAVPFFVLERHYSYVGASGLALAATLGSALPQVLVGLLADRHRLRWMSPVGLVVAGLGAGLAGLAGSYALVWMLLLISGFGVAMFHPPAGRDARSAAGDSASAMSLFAAGGSVGFFLAPALATPALDAWGVGATAVFIGPAVVMGYILWRHQRRTVVHPAARIARGGVDRWGMFGTLTAVEVVRSTISFGVNTFIALYWIRYLGASSSIAGLALALQLVGGVFGTLAGGRLGDRVGMVRTVQIGNIALIPALFAMLACGHQIAALPLVFVVGLVTNIPFAVLVKLGQDYLPNRPGTAAGVTLGLAVSAGGLFMPLLGIVADRWGTQAVFVVLGCIPVLALALSSGLREPTPTPEAV